MSNEKRSAGATRGGAQACQTNTLACTNFLVIFPFCSLFYYLFGSLSLVYLFPMFLMDPKNYSDSIFFAQIIILLF